MTGNIESNDLNISKVFHSYYRVPDYQRDYVWGENARKGSTENEVELLLTDIFEEYELHTKMKPAEYFIGTIITCENNQNTFDLIDGQQRLTTIFIALCAIRDKLVELEGEILSAIVAANDYDEGIYKSRSASNIIHCYATVKEFLNTKFGDDKEELLKYLGFLLNCVKLIRVETPNLTKALKIFATINDRGVGLDAMDLLKNLLFMNVNEDKFEKLKDNWKELSDIIFESKEKPLRFLRYYILADYHSDNKLREDDAYSWFQKNSKTVGIEKNPLKLVKSLTNAAKCFLNLRNGKSPLGKEDASVDQIKMLGGSALRQPYILLLAGRHLSSEMFSDLANLTENLLLMWLVTKTPSRDTEPEVVKLARAVSKIKANDVGAFTSFKADVEKSYFRKHSKEFSRSFVNLSQFDMPKYRIKYVLGKLTQYVEQAGFGASGANLSLANFTNSGIEIEHIFPQNPSKASFKEFGDKDEYEYYRYILGNLLLIGKTHNVIASNDAYSVKVKSYKETNWMMSKFIHSGPKVGQKDKISRAFKDLLFEYKDWHPENVHLRQKMLTRIAHQVWNIPLLTAEIPDWDYDPDEY